MTHIDQIEAILEQITGYSLTQSKINAGFTGIWIQPSKFYETLEYEEVEYFDVVITESSKLLIETKKRALISARNNVNFNYNDFDARGTIPVSDGTDFAVDDAIVGTTSGATGTVYKIDGNTLYLKTITGTWQVEAINGKTATCTAAQTVIIFPSYLTNELIRYDYDLDFNESVGGEFVCWIRFKALWGLV